MKKLSLGHTSPKYSEEVKDDALFHYTTAAGLLGILCSKQLWSTAYYCANDESELSAARGFLTPIIRKQTSKMIDEEDSRVKFLSRMGANIQDHADRFEEIIVNHTLNALCIYITCFCRPSTEEEFHHGLLSQWRGYGEDGGYAIQFSRSKLKKTVDLINLSQETNYDIQDVHYSVENPYKAEVVKHADAFINAYLEHLDGVININWNRPTLNSPTSSLTGGPLESLLDYLVNTKNEHFREEKECRLSLLETTKANSGVLPVEYYNRNGLLVPFTRTPDKFSLIDCIDWVIVGPSSGIEQRFMSLKQMVKKMGLDINIRPSHIPYSRSL
ncbi:MAG: hypothetical protein NPIRA01_12420 [Nitrospirales bacterium]|nr:MAG: hypothetical protein NPIRA01_12420 [Nitrospirales bacterium]